MSNTYYLFEGDNYYPGGGCLDFVSSHDSFEEALAKGNKRVLEIYSDWFQIADEEMRMIVEGRRDRNKEVHLEWHVPVQA